MLLDPVIRKQKPFLEPRKSRGIRKKGLFNIANSPLVAYSVASKFQKIDTTLALLLQHSAELVHVRFELDWLAGGLDTVGRILEPVS